MGLRGQHTSTGGASPYALAFDKAGNLFLANANNNSIEKITPDGVGSVFASTGMNYPDGLAFDAAGDLYVANGNLNNIVKFSPTGTYLGVFAGSGGVSPYGLAFDREGNLYVANDTSGGITKITPGGVGSAFGSVRALGLAFDSAGNLFAAAIQDNTVERFSPAGTDLGVFAHLNGPAFIAIQHTPPSIGEVSGEGSIRLVGGSAHFDFEVRRRAVSSPIRGILHYRHPGVANVQSVTFDTFTISGKTATFGGAGTYNGAPCMFSVSVQDSGGPAASDVFQINLSLPGVTEGGTLRSGNIQVHSEPHTEHRRDDGRLED